MISLTVVGFCQSWLVLVTDSYTFLLAVSTGQWNRQVKVLIHKFQNLQSVGSVPFNNADNSHISIKVEVQSDIGYC